MNKIRLPKEKGRIEYKAIDTIQDLKIYKGLIILLKGIILSNNLNEKSLTVNQELVEKSCIFGFHHKIIYEGCQEIICQAQKSLKNKEEKLYLDYLWSMLKSKNNLSVILKKEFKKLKSINKVLLRHSNFIR